MDQRQLLNPSSRPGNVSGDITPGQRRAVVALMGSASLTDAATAGGVSVRTLRRWRQSTTFQQALRASARQAATEATSRLLGAQGRPCRRSCGVQPLEC